MWNWICILSQIVNKKRNPFKVSEHLLYFPWRDSTCCAAQGPNKITTLQIDNHATELYNLLPLPCL